MDAKKRNKEIDVTISQDKKQDKMTVKLLLLGGSESGKSTIAKQMKILHLNGFEEAELVNFRCIIYTNVVDIVNVLLDSVKIMGIAVDDATQKQVELFKKCVEDAYQGRQMDDRVVYEIADRIWHSSAVQDCYKRRNEVQLPDNVQHFMSSLDRIAKTDYSPSDLDILYCRVATLGVHETKFIFKGRNFRLIDVGGQKSERRKWIHCFENVTAIFFIAALNGYDQKLVEDNTVNRMHDSVGLFSDIINNQYFTSASAILFLNKKDVFEEKITKVPLSVCYPEYTGTTVDEALDFLKAKFLAQVNDIPPTPQKSTPQRRKVYVHFTNATDTKNVDVVFIATADMILKKILGNVGVV